MHHRDAIAFVAATRMTETSVHREQMARLPEGARPARQRSDRHEPGVLEQHLT